MKKDKRSGNDLQSTKQKPKDRATRSPLQIGVTSGGPKGQAVPAPLVQCMWFAFQKIILKVLVLDYINVPVLSTGAINAIIWSPSRIISYQF